MPPWTMAPSPPKPNSWEISIQTKSIGLTLKLNPSNIFPNLGKCREKVTLFLNLPRFLSLKVESENRLDSSVSAPFLRSRLGRFFAKKLWWRFGFNKKKKKKNEKNRLGSPSWRNAVQLPILVMFSSNSPLFHGRNQILCFIILACLSFFLHEGLDWTKFVELLQAACIIFRDFLREAEAVVFV